MTKEALKKQNEQGHAPGRRSQMYRGVKRAYRQNTARPIRRGIAKHNKRAKRGS